MRPDQAAAAASQVATDRRFGDYLVANGLLHSEALRQALTAQASTGGRIDTVLLDRNLVAEDVLLHALGQFRSSRTASAADLANIPPEVVRMISPRMAIRLEVVPFRLEGRRLSIATLNPGDLLVEDELGLLTECMVSSHVALEARLYQALARLYCVSLSIQISSVLKRLDREVAPPESTMIEWRPAEPPSQADTAPVIGPRARPAGDSRAATAPADPTGSLAVEVSAEELDQFPSLRQGVAAVSGPTTRLHGRPADTPPPVRVEDRFVKVDRALQNAEMREDIADAVLEFCAPVLRRRLLLVVRGSTVIGWRGEGDGVSGATVRTIAIPLSEPSVFFGLSQGTEFWLGPLPRMARNQDLVRGLGGVPPAECIILPLIVRGKTVSFLYGDNVDQPVSGLPISQLRRLVAKASLAFQVYLLKGKIRSL